MAFEVSDRIDSQASVPLSFSEPEQPLGRESARLLPDLNLKHRPRRRVQSWAQRRLHRHLTCPRGKATADVLDFCIQQSFEVDPQRPTRLSPCALHELLAKLGDEKGACCSGNSLRRDLKERAEGMEIIAMCEVRETMDETAGANDVGGGSR